MAWAGNPKLDQGIFVLGHHEWMYFLNLDIMNESINDELATSHKVVCNPNLPTTILSKHKSLIQIVIWIVQFHFVNAS